MQIDDFKSVILTFADPGVEFIFDKRQILFSVNAVTISAELSLRSGEVYVTENDKTLPANQWIISRLANVPLLANRILEKIKNEDEFIEPSARLLPSLTHESMDDDVFVKNALQALIKSLDDRSPLETSMIYITSDAGEGKTWLINAAARTQAKRFESGESDWLLVPIVLGGRNFLRFDDITVGALQNRYRFPFLYYNSFLALVRMGVLVPAFDGFEEMFVESSSGEALSAMGILVNALNSTGAVTIAARKAYFEFENLKSQEKLYDAIKSFDVSFSQIQINRWNKCEFIDYAILRGIDNPVYLYDSVSKRLGVDHSLLTRPVLVHRLITIVKQSSSLDDFLSQVSVAGANFFAVFVKEIIRREANEKWVDRSGSGESAALITVDEHCELLSMISVQMWESRASYLKIELLDVVADLFCEIHKKTPHQMHQIRERVRGHALLISSPDVNSAVEFDHDEFRLFFLGEGLASLILNNLLSSKSEIFSILRRGAIPDNAVQSCLYKIKRNEESFCLPAISLLHSISKLDGQASYTRENCGGLIIKLLNGIDGLNVEVDDLIFGSNALLDCDLYNIVFSNCYFSSSSLESMKMNYCQFKKCEFGILTIHENTVFNNVAMTNCVIEAIKEKNMSYEVWNPEEINQRLIGMGVSVGNASILLNQANNSNFDDNDINAVQKIIRYFLRSTQISESIIRIKLSDDAPDFVNRLLPELVDVGVMVEVDNKGRGNRRIFKLGKPLKIINEYLSKSFGSYAKFIDNARSS